MRTPPKNKFSPETSLKLYQVRAYEKYFYVVTLLSKNPKILLLKI